MLRSENQHNEDSGEVYAAAQPAHTALSSSSMPSGLARYGDGGVGVFCGRIAAPAQFPEHAQPRVEVSVPFGEASGPAHWQTVTGRRVTRRIREGHTSVIPAEMPHSGEWEREAEVLVFYLEPGFLAHVAHESLGGDTVEVVEAATAEDPLIRQLGLAVREELHSSGPLGKLYVESVAAVLATHLLRHYRVGKPLREPRGVASEPALQRSVEYIHDNLSRDLTLSELAREADLSLYHFSRLFRQSMGQTPRQYVIYRRVEWAKKLLLRGDLSVAEVATRVGFFDSSHFARYFKRLTGVAPSTLLHQNSNNLPKNGNLFQDY